MSRKQLKVKDQRYLALKVVNALHNLPAYHKEYNGIHVEYGAQFSIRLSGPKGSPMPLSKTQFQNLIESTFRNFGVKAWGFVSHTQKNLKILKEGKLHDRIAHTVMIRYTEFYPGVNNLT